jgi:hypothetical protein
MSRLATRAGGQGSRPRRSTRAYHEAGHAIWGRQIGLRIHRISIRISGGLWPVTEFDYSGVYENAHQYSDSAWEDISWEAEQFLQKKGNRRLVENFMVRVWAGPAAQMKLSRKVLPIHLQDDEKSLHRYAVYLGRGDQAEAERLARVRKARAVDFVNDPESWRLIQKLAKYLEKRLELKGEDVDRLLGPARPG